MHRNFSHLDAGVYLDYFDELIFAWSSFRTSHESKTIAMSGDICYSCTAMPLTEKDQTRLQSYDSKARTKRQFTNKEMEQALCDAAKGHNGPLSREQYQDYYARTANVPHSYTIIRRYGKWNEALRKARLPIRKRAPYQVRINKTDCIVALLDARRILGHLPSVGEYTKLWKQGDASHEALKEQNHPSPSTIRLKYGKWREANAEAARYIDKPVPEA